MNIGSKPSPQQCAQELCLASRLSSRRWGKDLGSKLMEIQPDNAEVQLDFFLHSLEHVRIFEFET